MFSHPAMVRGGHWLSFLRPADESRRCVPNIRAITHALCNCFAMNAFDQSVDADTPYTCMFCSGHFLAVLPLNLGTILQLSICCRK